MSSTSEYDFGTLQTSKSAQIHFSGLKIDPFQSRQVQNASKHAANSPELRTTTPALKRTKPSGGRFAKRSQYVTVDELLINLVAVRLRR